MNLPAQNLLSMPELPSQSIHQAIVDLTLQIHLDADKSFGEPSFSKPNLRSLKELPNRCILQTILDLTLQDGCKLLQAHCLVSAQVTHLQNSLDAIPAKHNLGGEVRQTLNDI